MYAIKHTTTWTRLSHSHTLGKSTAFHTAGFPNTSFTTLNANSTLIASFSREKQSLNANSTLNATNSLNPFSSLGTSTLNAALDVRSSSLGALTRHLTRKEKANNEKATNEKFSTKDAATNEKVLTREAATNEKKAINDKAINEKATKLETGKNVSIERRKLTYYHTIYQTISSRNWGRVDSLLSQFKSEGLNYDEVIYTLLVHLHVLSPTSRCENAYLVIEEMKRAHMSPTIIRMNEMLINSYLELEGIFCQPPKNSWQSILRMAWQSALAFVRARKKQMVKRLEEMPPDQLLSLTADDIDEMIKQENMIQSNKLELQESQDVPMALGIEANSEDHEFYHVQELQEEVLNESS